MSRSHYFFVHWHRLSKRKRLRTFDRTVLAASFVYPLSGIPQVLAIWTGDGKASILTWICFLLFGFLSLTYGIVHKIKPMIVGNIIWTFIDLAVIIGLLVN